MLANDGRVPPRFLDAVTTPGVRSAMGRIAQIVLAHGAVIHPGAQLHERDGNMTVLCPEADEGEELFSMPLDLLTPVDGARWDPSPEVLRVVSTPPDLTPVQRTLLAAMVEGYNAAGKLPEAVRTHPRLALAQQPALVAAIAALRPGFATAEGPPAQVFLDTRTLSLDRAHTSEDATEASSGERAPKVLLPLLDALNHHRRGAGFGPEGDRLRVGVTRPTGSAECFAYYGHRRDPLDLALQYGYLDLSVMLARSGPVRLVLPGVGVLSVVGGARPPKNPLDPPAVQLTGDGLVLSHATLDAAHPDRFHASLRMVVQSVALRAGSSASEARRAAESAVAGVLAANRDLLTRVVQEADRSLGEPAADLVGGAAKRQLQIIGEVEKWGGAQDRPTGQLADSRRSPRSR